MYRCDLKNRNTLYNLYVDHLFNLNSDLKAIVKMTRSSLSPELYANGEIAKQFFSCGTKF